MTLLSPPSSTFRQRTQALSDWILEKKPQLENRSQVDRTLSEIIRTSRELTTALRREKVEGLKCTAEDTEQDIEAAIYTAYVRVQWVLGEVGFGDEERGRPALALALAVKIIQEYNMLVDPPIPSGRGVVRGLTECLIEYTKGDEAARTGIPATVSGASQGLGVQHLPLPSGCPWSVAKAEDLELTFEEWKSRVQTAVSSYRLRGLQACCYAMKCLEGAELLYAQQCMTSIDITQVSPSPVEVLLTTMQAHYSRSWSMGRTVHRFETMTMKTDETAVGFLGRVKERGLAVNQDHTVTAAEYRQRLIFGLPRWLKRRLEGFYGPRLHSTSADDLADTADYFRVTELQEKETQYDRAPDRARGLKGVYEPSQTSQRGEAQKIRACHRCGSLVHLKADCQVPADVKCSNCGRTGHAMAACRDVRCRRCNKKGHLAKNCQKGDSRSQNGAKAVQSNQATQEGKKETSQGPTASQGLVEVHIAAAVAQETPGTMKIHSIGERDSPPLLKCDLGDTGICVQEVLLDSGAACSLIPRQIVEDLKKLGGVKVLATPRAIKLIYADGSTALSKEEAIVPVRLREHSDKLAYIPFVIVDCPLPRVIPLPTSTVYPGREPEVP